MSIPSPRQNNRLQIPWPIAVLAALLLGGCQTEVVDAPISQKPLVVVNGQQWSGDNPPPTKQPPIEQAINSDPCAARLHEISGAMLEFFAINARLPRQLDELQTLTDLDRPLSFVCPTSSKPYTYVPTGLRSADEPRLIIVYDSTADNSGQRWAILMQKPKGRQPAAMWVMSLSEPVFRTYTAPPIPATRPISAN